MNENLLRKCIEGGLTDDEIIRAQIAAERAEIEAEAKRREQIRIDLEESAAARDRRLQRMVFLDHSAESATREYEKLLQEFDDFCLDFGKRLLAAKGKIIESQRSFSGAVKTEIPKVDRLNNYNEPELEAELSELLETLEKRGASLSSICSEIWQPYLYYKVAMANGRYNYPTTKFGALVDNVEKIVLMILGNTPAPDRKAA